MRARPFRTFGVPAVRLVGVLALAVSAAVGGEGVHRPEPSEAQRLELIRRARVWEPSDVAAKDLYNGPAGRLPYAVYDEVRCAFVPKPMSGWTEKFACRLDDRRVVKVKYEAGGRYKEVFGEVLGTRLYWALGFFADRMIPVHVTCEGCPEHPWQYVDSRKRLRLDHEGHIASFPASAHLGTYRFELATIEEKLDAEPVKWKGKQGWKWSLLRDVNPAQGGSTKAEIDAFELLNAFVQNADNKSIQNELACPRSAIDAGRNDAVSCPHPIMYVSDLGSVFGKGGFTSGNEGRVDYEGWAAREVWRDKETCRARLTSVGGGFRTSTLKDPVIGEEGRALLAKLLGALSDAQIADLFRGSRILELHETMDDGARGRREVTLDDWVELFKRKRSEITEHPGCKPR